MEIEQVPPPHIGRGGAGAEVVARSTAAIMAPAKLAQRREDVATVARQRASASIICINVPVNSFD